MADGRERCRAGRRVACVDWSWVWRIADALIAVPLTAATVITCGQFDRSRWIARMLSA